MTFTEFQALKEKNWLLRKNDPDNKENDRRCLKDRREFTYTGYTPERRSGKDRRKNQILFDFENYSHRHIYKN